MLLTLKDLDQYKLIFVLYPAGSSGEFLTYALSQCVEGVFYPHARWENMNRMKFRDCFGRRLAIEPSWPDESDMVDQFNKFLEIYKPTAHHHILSMAHPNRESIAWMLQHCGQCPVIEIVTHSHLSQKFRDLAATEKIGPKLRGCYHYTKSGAVFPKHIEIEWLHCILTDTGCAFERICNFLDMPGDSELFCRLVADYRDRNAHLIDAAHAS